VDSPEQCVSIIVLAQFSSFASESLSVLVGVTAKS